MKDLKHLIYFESLLDNADNELVEQAKKDGKLIMGYTCYHIPEVLRQRTGRTGEKGRQAHHGLYMLSHS